MEASAALKPLDPIQIKESIEAAWQSHILAEEGRPPAKRPYSYASSYEECDRKLALYITEGDKLPPFDVQTLAKFHRGNDRARNLKIDLELAGQRCSPKFTLVGQEERFELRDHKGRVALAGKTDCRLHFSKSCQPPVEIKDWNENITSRIDSFDDCFSSPWAKKGAFQLLMYLLGSGEPFGFLLLGKSGLPALLPVKLDDHLDKAEDFLQKAERALDAAQSGVLPPFIDDAAECKRCGFLGSVCNPPISTGPGAKILDAEWEPVLERRSQLEEGHKEYEALDKQVKGAFRGLEMGVVGSFVLQGKWGKQTSYEIPEDLKEKYKKVDPKGRFTLTIQKV